LQSDGKQDRKEIDNETERKRKEGRKKPTNLGRQGKEENEEQPNKPNEQTNEHSNQWMAKATEQTKRHLSFCPLSFCLFPINQHVAPCCDLFAPRNPTRARLIPPLPKKSLV
jgi:hypothetical protein